MVEEKMRQYIEEQLDKRRRDSSDAKRPREEVQASSQSAEVESADEQSSEAAVLHDVAPLLRRKAVLDEKEEESAERWLRGIAEVQLPMEHRMNNVERTEAARARVTQTQQSSMLTQPPSALPANYNSNFAMHKVTSHTTARAHVGCTPPATCSLLSLSPVWPGLARTVGVGRRDERAVEAAH